MFKKLSKFTVLLLSVSVNLASANVDQDIQAIKRQVGCFHVKFDFRETSAHGPNPRFSPREEYKEQVNELVTLERDTPDEISLVHTLLIGKGPFPQMKHWRQTWVKNAKSIWEYQSNYKWNKRDLTPEESSQWVQKVFRIDDGPNRECVGSWKHTATKSFWKCSSLSPIFRRDYGRAAEFDYNYHIHKYEISEDSLFLGEEIQKRKGNNRNFDLVAVEIGGSTYTEDAPAEVCQEGMAWWNQHRAAWNEIEAAWSDVYENSTEIRVKNRSETPAKTLRVWKKIWPKLFRYGSPPENPLAWLILPGDQGKTPAELIREDWDFE